MTLPDLSFLIMEGVYMRSTMSMIVISLHLVKQFWRS